MGHFLDGHHLMKTIDPSNRTLLREDVFSGQDISTLNFHPDGTNDPQGANAWVFGLDYNGDYGESKPFGGTPYLSGRVQSTPDGLTLHVWQNNNGNGTGLHMQTVGADKKGFTFNRCYVEVEAKLPRGVGMWPGFWLMDANRPNVKMSTNGSSISNVEVDFLEFYPERTPRDKNYDRALIAWDGGTQRNVGWTRAKSNIDVNDAADNFHTYGFEYNGTEAIFYRDRVETHRETIDLQLLEDREFYLLITLTTEYINAQFTQAEFDALYAQLPSNEAEAAVANDAGRMIIKRVSVWGDEPASPDPSTTHSVTEIVQIDGKDYEVDIDITVTVEDIAD